MKLQTLAKRRQDERAAEAEAAEAYQQFALAEARGDDVDAAELNAALELTGRDRSEYDADVTTARRAFELDEAAGDLEATQAALREAEKHWMAWTAGSDSELNRRLAAVRRDLRAAADAWLSAIEKERTAAAAAVEAHRLRAGCGRVFPEPGPEPQPLATLQWAVSVRNRLQDFDKTLSRLVRVDIAEHPVFSGEGEVQNA